MRPCRSRSIRVGAGRRTSIRVRDSRHGGLLTTSVLRWRRFGITPAGPRPPAWPCWPGWWPFWAGRRPPSSSAAAHTNALVYSTWRLWMAVPPLGIFVLVRRRRGHQSPLQTPGVTRRVWALVIVGAGALFVAGMVTTFAAINKTSLLDVTLIGSLQPVLIVGFAVAFLGERARTSYLVRGVIAIGGALLVRGVEQLRARRPRRRHAGRDQPCPRGRLVPLRQGAA